MKLVTALLLTLFTATAMAQDFMDATIVDVQSKQGFKNGFLAPPGTIEADNYKELVVTIGTQKITARTYSMGGGLIYLANHPEALVVGSTVQARLAKRGELQVKTAEGKVLKFTIQRIEQLSQL